jgi:hypothetical protein
MPMPVPDVVSVPPLMSNVWLPLPRAPTIS